MLKIKSVFDDDFRKYGRVLDQFDFTELLNVLKNMDFPQEGVFYEPQTQALEQCGVMEELMTRGFGGLPVEIGLCAGKNRKLNCLEYHKSSEYNITADDMVLLLGKEQDITDDFSYDTAKVEAFFVPAGMGVELYATTLHYAPCNIEKEGFRVACVLPLGTNRALSEGVGRKSGEDALLLAVNKWLLAHLESEEACGGAYVGLFGENLVSEYRKEKTNL